MRKLPTLRGRTVVNLFFEDSTRTRISFELAAKRLSADVINFSAKGSSVSKGESLKDTAWTLQAMGADAVVCRHSSSGAPQQLSGWVDGHVINAGDGTHEHPTQALLDAYTLRRHLGRWTAGGSSWSATCCTPGSPGPTCCCCRPSAPQVTLVAPPTLLPVGVRRLAGRGVLRPGRGAGRRGRGDDAARAAGADERRVLPDGARVQPRRTDWIERRRALHRRRTAIVHAPRADEPRAWRSPRSVADGADSVIVEQVANGVTVRMAVLYLLLSGEIETGDDCEDHVTRGADHAARRRTARRPPTCCWRTG